MRVLIDTNVILDALTGRRPYFDIADKILKLCSDGEIEGYMAAHSIPNMFYILRKDLSENDRREVLLSLCDILTVEGIDGAKILSALKNSKFADLEDCLQDECAVSISAEYIVTRNIKDYANSKIPAILPDQFISSIPSVQIL